MTSDVHFIDVNLDADASYELNAVDSIDTYLDSMEKNGVDISLDADTNESNTEDGISIDSDTDASDKPNVVDSNVVDSDVDISDKLNIVDDISKDLDSIEKDCIITCEFATLCHHY